MPKRPLCVKCGKDEKKPKSPTSCWECWLAEQHIQLQVVAARIRLARVPVELRLARVPKEEWPEGRRWCSGCCSFVRLIDCASSQCRACVSSQAYGRHIAATYGMTQAQYEELLRAQGGRCYICGRRPGKRRLAVDHSHETGKVRGLLCAASGGPGARSCNYDVVGTLEALGDGIELARRVVDYLERPPAERLWGADVPVQPEGR